METGAENPSRSDIEEAALAVAALGTPIVTKKASETTSPSGSKAVVATSAVEEEEVTSAVEEEVVSEAEPIDDDDDDDNDDDVVEAEAVEAEAMDVDTTTAVVVEAKEEDATDVAMEAAEEDDDEDAVVAEAVIPESSPSTQDDDATEAVVVVPKKPSSARKAASKKAGADRRRSVGSGGGGVSTARQYDAEMAREMLESTVLQLPLPINDAWTVRNLGQLCVSAGKSNNNQSKNDPSSLFSTPTALYPIGFSCDRYDFSPIHGRLLKLRCSILDGRQCRRRKSDADKNGASGDDGEQLASYDHDGPVFRIMWGPGVDDDDNKMDAASGGGAIDYPYHVYTHSAPIASSRSKENTGTDGKVKPNTASLTDHASFTPVPGMRVQVRFDKNVFYYGSILQVESSDDDDHEKATATPKKKQKKQEQRRTKVVLLYDDGSTEDADFPDPDITLVLPGNDEADLTGVVEHTELNGKPVRTAIGRTPIEAWSMCLIKMGLVDETIVELAKEAVEAVANNETKKTVAATPNKKALDNAAVGNDDKKENDESKQEAAEQEAVAEPESQTERELKEAVAEPESQTERELKEQLKQLEGEYDEAKHEDDIVATALMDARISLLGRLLVNPFKSSALDKEHQAAWMTTAIRKEKSKMGSTGNKKKVVTAADLLERNNTFYNAEIESLLEGLPGSEFCSQYVFQSSRGTSSAGRAWLQEQQLRHERQKHKKVKQTKVAKAKTSQEKEREIKRKKRETERDARKRQKLEEDIEKKKERTKERLTRLTVQVDDRLFKEASFQREKVVALMAKNLNKEMNRRRKAAELVAAQVVVETKAIRTPGKPLAELPPLAKRYDEDVLRVWDFVSTFGDFFKSKGYVDALPTLEVLQKAFDTLHGSKSDMSRPQALRCVTDLAVSLCKPLSAGLTRMLFASLIALNPALQKDFGAAFFNEVNSTKPEKTVSEDGVAHSDVLLPVNVMTWKEIARIALQSDALGELGFSRQEQAHLLRGYRSAGHPNSKEARRLRRVENHSLELARQTLTTNKLRSRKDDLQYLYRIDSPSIPSCDGLDWKFFLHNVKSIDVSEEAPLLRQHLSKALDILRKSPNPGPFLADLEKCLALLPEGEVLSSSPAWKESRSRALVVLDSASGEIFSRDTIGRIEKDMSAVNDEKETSSLEQKVASLLHRARMGQLSFLVLTPQSFKELTRVREEYMSDALRLKEELKRQELKEAGEDIDDDEDDDEEEEENGTTKIGKDGEPKKEVAQNAEIVEEQKNSDAPVGDVAATDAVVDSTAAPPPSRDGKIGKPTEHDDFCEDIPSAPELLRRCMAVLRTLAMSASSDPFVNPVDPQTNPAYYDMLVRPMSMREVGVRLRKAAEKYETLPTEEKEQFLEEATRDFARDVRMIGRNCLSYANAGPTVISAGSEMLRIFERLLLDWVLAPEGRLSALDKLDDDLCVDPHPTDVHSTVLLCDGCEGNFNIERLNPPLVDIPKGDWYCPRCLQGQWWGDLDPRIGNEIKLRGEKGSVMKCKSYHLENHKGPSLLYSVKMVTGTVETLSQSAVDEALLSAGTPVPKIRCIEAVAESSGYGAGIDHGIRHDLVPVLLNPNVSDTASQVALSSTVFRDSIAAASTLLVNDSQEMTGKEWLRLLILLVMKCSASDMVQNVTSDMETAAAERLAKKLERNSKINDLSQVLPNLTNDESGDVPTMEEITSGEVIVPATQVPGEPKSNEPIVPAKPVDTGGKTDVSSTVVVASAVEVLESTADPATSAAEVAPMEIEPVLTAEEERKALRVAMLAQRGRRQKARDDGIAAFCIQNQLRCTVASFERDCVSDVVQSSLASALPGLSFAATRCRGHLCDFCGLSDITLGTNLVRVPDELEWEELIAHVSTSRKTSLIADLGSQKEHPMMKVSVVVGGELVASDRDAAHFEGITDGGMVDFLPRNPEGFQDELLYRYEHNIPFATGSLTAHEGCAIAAHNSRKVKVVEEYKDHQAEALERFEGMGCGRTLEVGQDLNGRSYWYFNTDQGSLFVADKDDSFKTTWLKYEEPQAIASVMVALGKDPIVEELKKSFPKAKALLKGGKWSDLLQKQAFNLVEKIGDENDSIAMEVDDVADEEEEEPYDEGEDVLVESADGRKLHDAKVIGSSTPVGGGKVNGYRVTYTGWSSRFDEWVGADRVVEPSENNRKVQEEMLEQATVSKDGLPPTLESMEGKQYLHARDRVRGTMPLPNFASIAHTDLHAPEDVQIFSAMKAALLVIEAALPLGSVNHLERGAWNPRFSAQWRLMVRQSNGAWDMMRAVILLEDAIAEDWMKEKIGHLRSCLPSRWMALIDASPSSLALRIQLLDRGIKYEQVDKRKHRNPKAKK